MGSPISPANAVLRHLGMDVCRTPDDLAAATGLTNHNVVAAAGRLIARGLADRREVGCYVLTPEGAAFLAGGKVVKSGPVGPLERETPRRMARATTRDRLWSAMRILGKFSLGDLLALADEGRRGYANARNYLSILTRAGYLRELPRREPGTAVTSNGFKRWALVRNTGPAAPVWRPRNGQIYDLNLGEATWTKGGVA